MNAKLKVTDARRVDTEPASATRGVGVELVSKWPEILEKLTHAETPVLSILRLIAWEIALLCHEIGKTAEHPALHFKLQPFQAEIRAARELSRILLLLAKLSAETDTLNVDGPKFQYVVAEIFGLFKKSILEAGYEQSAANSIMMHFRDNVAVREPDIRRGLKHVAGVEGKAGTILWPGQRGASGDAESKN